MTDTLSIKTLDAFKDGNNLLELLSSGAVIPMIVTGSSMLPFLKDGRDTVLLQKADTFKKGQILFFRRRNGFFVLHRIRKIRRDGRILVNGDAQNWCEVVMPEQAAAVVIGFVRNGKTCDADSFLIRLRDALWYPTRPLRPLIFRLASFLRRLFPRRG
ncbi:MAG: S24/S26 family peptidase [Clostridia bacterium]|nr:S24/S26 family peptidase [Clostridia bacterium]